MFGNLDDWHYSSARVVSREIIQMALDIAQFPLEMLVRWYWDEPVPYWKDYVNQYNALPNPVPQYEMQLHDNGVILVPLAIPLPSAKHHKFSPIPAVFDHPTLILGDETVDSPVDNPVYNSGTTLYNLAVVPKKTGDKPDSPHIM